MKEKSDEFFGILEKAKEVVPCDESDEKYYTLLYFCLRAKHCSFKEAVSFICSLSKTKGVEINWRHLWGNNTDYAGNHETAQIGSPKMNVNEIEEIQKAMSFAKNRNGVPKSNVGNIIWIELIMLNAAQNSELTIQNYGKICSELLR